MPKDKGVLTEIFGSNPSKPGTLSKKVWGRPKIITGKKSPPQFPRKGKK